MASIFMCLSQRLISKYSSVSIVFCVQVAQCSLSIPPLYPVSSTFFTSLFALTVRNGHVKDSWSLTLCLIKTDAVLMSGKGTNCIRQQQTPQ